MPARPLMVAAVLAGFVAAAQAQPLPPVTVKVGDPAPPLTISKWIKGEPAKIEPGKVYVVEFWATWCPTCHISVPHLTALAKKRPDVVVIGQNVDASGPTEGNVGDVNAKIARYVDKLGDQMDYRIALDDTSKDPVGAMTMNWLVASGENALPVAFVIDKNAKIAWIGHPIDESGDPKQFLDVVDRVAAGTFDAKAEAAAAQKLVDLNKQLAASVRAKNVDEALKASAELAKLKPDSAEQYTLFEYGLLARAGRLDEARVRANKIVQTAKDASSFHMIAWTTAVRKDPTPDDLKLARTAADKAVAMTGGKQADFLDTSARLYAVEKNWAKAVETQKQAIDVAEADAKAELQTALEAYQKQTIPAAN